MTCYGLVLEARGDYHLVVSSVIVTSASLFKLDTESTRRAVVACRVFLHQILRGKTVAPQRSRNAASFIMVSELRGMNSDTKKNSLHSYITPML